MSMQQASQAAAPVLSIRDVTVTARATERKVIERISFDIQPGETVCVVGESGSGKSVTSLAVMGLLPKTALALSGGEIWLEGENITQASQQRLRQLRAHRMAMVFQEPMTALNPVMTIGAQLDEVLRTHTRMPAAQRRAKILAILDSVHLPDRQRMVDSFPHQLRADSGNAW